jgi:mutator protein MutT
VKSTPKVTKQITVFVGLVIHNEKLLMVKRFEPEVKGAHLKWEIPGGKVDFGENPEQTIVREIKEETGVKVKVKRLLPTVYTKYWDYPWGIQHTILLGYECELISEGKRIKEPELFAHKTKRVKEKTEGEYRQCPSPRHRLRRSVRTSLEHSVPSLFVLR